MKKIFIFGALLSLVLGFGSNSSAHFNYSSYHSVDGKEIRWGTFNGSTKYTAERNNAISKWDALGIINIAGDTTSTIEDLSFTDYYYVDGYSGNWYLKSGADEITFNDAYMPYFSQQCERNKVQFMN